MISSDGINEDYINLVKDQQKILTNLISSHTNYIRKIESLREFTKTIETDLT